MRSLVEETHHEINDNEIEIERLRTWAIQLCKKFKNGYKVVSLRV